MLIMANSLVLGPFDWNSELLPKVEFEDRIRAAMQIAKEHNHLGLIVH